MASEKTLMDFKQAIEYMDPMQVTDYLHKILDFLKRNNNELCFPNISPYVEAFLVNLVTDTRNLNCKSLSVEHKKLASEIIDVLEMSKDVFRWSHAYQNGKIAKNLLVYKKIYSNKMKATKPSTINHRLTQAQTPSQTEPPLLTPKPQNPNESAVPLISTGFKIHVLNKTLRFIKNDAETVLVYDDMSSHQAEYVNTLFKQHEKDIGFGYKSLYAPLWEALELYGQKYLFKMSLTETNKKSVLKLQKISRNGTKEAKNSKDSQEKATAPNVSVATKDENISNNHKTTNQSLDTSIRSDSSTQCALSETSNTTSSNTTNAAPEMALLNNVSDKFAQDTVIALTEFAEDASRASITFDQLSDDEMCFVKKIKLLAASKDSRNMFTPRFRNLLVNLNVSIVAALKTCKITTTVSEKERGLTLKKSPIFPAPTATPSTSGARSKSLTLTKVRERSLSRDRMIQFQKASKHSTDNESPPDKESAGTMERGRTKERGDMSKRTAKLLEDMSTPVESDRGIRMMLLMGWKGGALGARGDGIMEPIIPLVDAPSKAGLGHVPPPKPVAPPKPAAPRQPVDFRTMLLHNILDLLQHDNIKKEIQYKEPLTKKENNFISTSITNLNMRHPLGLCDKEAELTGLLLRELSNNPRIALRVEVSHDLRTLTIIKTDNLPAPLRGIKSKVLKSRKADLLSPPQYVTNATEVMITLHDAMMTVPYVDTMGLNAKNTIKRATRLVFLMKMADVLRGGLTEITFKASKNMPKRMMVFFKDIIDSINQGVWCHSLLGSEGSVYIDMQNCARGFILSIDFSSYSSFILRKTPIIKAAISNKVAEPKELNNNNNGKEDKQNKIQANGNDKQIKRFNSSRELITITVENNVNDNSLLRAIAKHNEKDGSDANIDMKIDDKDINACHKSTEKTIVNDENHDINTPIENGDVNVVNYDFATDVDCCNLITCSDKDNVEVKIDTECDKSELDNDCYILDNWEQIDLCHNEENDSEAETLVHADSNKSDLDRDIQDLETAITKADLNSHVKIKHDSNDSNALEIEILKAGHSIKKEKNTERTSDLEMSIYEAELSFKIKKEKDVDTSPYHKRSRNHSICSAELDPKRTKIASDEKVVVIFPKNRDEKITEDIAIQVQSLISIELDKGGFLPLLKCYGIVKAGLIYGCHDNDDLAWLKNVISGANFDLEVATDNDLCLDKKNRKFVIRINSFVPLDTTKIFKNFETYNAGLNTKYWKVLSEHTNSNFVLLIVEVDEKSLQYISLENFSLYCGIDKAQFSIIF